MSKTTLSTLTREELEAKLKTIGTITKTTTCIFVIIILVWVVLGYWKTNIPVFISTVCVAVVSSSSQFAIRQGIRAELNKRKTDAAKTNADKPT